MNPSAQRKPEFNFKHFNPNNGSRASCSQSSHVSVCREGRTNLAKASAAPASRRDEASRQDRGLANHSRSPGCIHPSARRTRQRSRTPVPGRQLISMTVATSPPCSGFRGERSSWRFVELAVRGQSHGKDSIAADKTEQGASLGDREALFQLFAMLSPFS